MVNDIQALPSTNAQIDILTQNDVSSYTTADLVVNATPVGMWPNNHENPLPEYIPHSNQWFFDLVYNPIETRLMTIFKNNGCKIISGIDMLIHQAASSFEFWTGISPDISVMRQAAMEVLNPISSK